jgi:SAM-dependent methyltransferase
MRGGGRHGAAVTIRCMSVVHTTKLRLAILGERLQGLDFTRANQQPAELGLDEREVFIPSPSGGRHLQRVLDDLVIEPGESALDIGCAKGSAMRDLLRHPFARVDGLELSPQLAAIARRNFARLKERRVHIYCTDARSFTGYGDYAVFYLYNPFPPPILEQVLVPLLAQTPAGAERVVIYNNPTGHAEMLRAGFHLLQRYPDFWGHGIQVYSNRKDSQRLRG